jgi:hypothetical protein
MLRRTLQLLVIALMVPVPALAADLTFALQGDTQYDSNVFRRENDIEDDWLFHIVPSVELHEDRGQDANYSLGYRMPVRFAVEHNDRLNDIDHIANGEIRYHVNDRMDVFASDNFRYLRTTVQEADAALDPTSVPTLSTRDQRVTINRAELGTSYRFAPRLTGQLVGHSTYFDSEIENRQENWGAGVIGDLQYTLNAQHVVGFGVRYIHMKFQDSANIVGSTSDTYNAFVSWRYQISENTAFSISAGPSYIAVDQDDVSAIVSGVTPIPVFTDRDGDRFVFSDTSCPVGPSASGSSRAYIPFDVGCRQLVLLDEDPGEDGELVTLRNTGTVDVVNANASGDSSSDLTVFGGVELSQRWTPNLASALRYDRSQGNASGLGGTVTRDAVSFATTWDFRERWRFAFRADWTHRKSVADAAQVFWFVNDGTLPIPAPIALTNSPGDFAAEFDGSANTASTASNSIETNRWGVAGLLNYRMWRNTNLFTELAFHQQSSKTGSAGGFSDFDAFRATFGVRHVFEPIKLW